MACLAGFWLGLLGARVGPNNSFKPEENKGVRHHCFFKALPLAAFNS